MSVNWAGKNCFHWKRNKKSLRRKRIICRFDAGCIWWRFSWKSIVWSLWGNRKNSDSESKIGGKEILAQLAKKPGLIVNDVPTYDTFYEEQEIIDIKNLFENGEIQTAVFTSASTVRGFVNAVSGLDFEKVRAACIGKQTKQKPTAMVCRHLWQKRQPLTVWQIWL